MMVYRIYCILLVIFWPICRCCSDAGKIQKMRGFRIVIFEMMLVKMKRRWGNFKYLLINKYNEVMSKLWPLRSVWYREHNGSVVQGSLRFIPQREGCYSSAVFCWRTCCWLSARKRNERNIYVYRNKGRKWTNDSKITDAFVLGGRSTKRSLNKIRKYFTKYL